MRVSREICLAERPPLGRRKGIRSRALISATLLVNNRESATHATVLNLSDHGCCLLFSHPLTLPNTFEIIVHDTMRFCEVVWRKHDRVGVRFT